MTVVENRGSAYGMLRRLAEHPMLYVLGQPYFQNFDMQRLEPETYLHRSRKDHRAS